MLLSVNIIRKEKINISSINGNNFDEIKRKMYKKYINHNEKIWLTLKGHRTPLNLLIITMNKKIILLFHLFSPLYIYLELSAFDKTKNYK